MIFSNSKLQPIAAIITVAVLLLISPGFAQASKSPEQVVSDTFNLLIGRIEENRSTYRQNPSALYNMVEEVLAPAIHVESIASKILGKHSRGASAQQKREFADEFKKLLIYTYAVLLLEYNGQELVINPSQVVGSDRVVVKTELVADSQSSIPINFYMSNRGEQTWRARNLEGAGINFVSTYRSTYGPNIAKNGLDSVIAELRAKNAALIN